VVSGRNFMGPSMPGRPSSIEICAMEMSLLRS
jgi:hypothetical protein